MLEISELHLFEVELPKGINVQTHYFLRTLEIEILSKNNNKKKYNSAHTHITISQNLLKLESWLSEEPGALLFLIWGVDIKQQRTHIFLKA